MNNLSPGASKFVVNNHPYQGNIHPEHMNFINAIKYWFWFSYQTVYGLYSKPTYILHIKDLNDSSITCLMDYVGPNLR